MYKKFILLFAAFATAGFLMTGAVNILVDPYGIWGVHRVVGFNMLSPQAEKVERLVKPIEFLRLDPMPHTVFLGTSQVLYAFDMDTYKQMTGHDAYNFGVRGASLHEQRCFLEHMLAVDENLQHVYLGLSFSNFIHGQYFSADVEPKSFLDISEQLGEKHITWDSLARTVFSFAALRESKAKILANMQKRWTHPYYTASGKPYDDNLLEFCKKDHWYFDRTLILLERDGIYRGAELDEDAWSEFESIVRLCRDNNVELTLFIPPEHAIQMEEFAGSWDTYEAWRSRLCQVGPVLDCAGYNSMTVLEPLPGLVDEDTHPYFWDVMHCKTVLGDKVIAQLVGDSSDPLGVWLTEDNLQQHLQNLRAGCTEWENSHPEVLEEIRYYRGFSPLVPQKLQGHDLLQGQSIVRLQYARQAAAPDTQVRSRLKAAKLGKDVPFELELSQSDHIDVRGTSFNWQPPVCMYALLEDASGHNYYAMAEPVGSIEAGNYMHSSQYDESGFRIYVSLRDLPVGVYGLKLVEVRQDGVPLVSDRLGMLTLTTSP